MKVPFADLIEAKQGRIDLDQLGATLAYCHMSGRIAWRTGHRAGLEAGTAKSGYIRINFKGNIVCAHRLAWVLHYGAWPVGVIDHINRDRADNRIVNLRDVTPTENARNKVRKRRSA